MPPLQASAGRANSTGTPRPRDAASLILLRDGAQSLEVLLGRREPRSRFMPSIWVFPGGRLDPADWRGPSTSELGRRTAQSLAAHTSTQRARALAHAALRETFEETGLAVGHGSKQEFASDLAALSYVGRAITPTTSPMRYHARFFSCRAEHAVGRLRGNGELLGLRWFSLPKALDLPIIDVTRVMLEEVAARATRPSRTTSQNIFVHYRNEQPIIRREP
jgi:8-oxo-dGTP pyrophosphatase MutT (NUDIX family)